MKGAESLIDGGDNRLTAWEHLFLFQGFLTFIDRIFLRFTAREMSPDLRQHVYSLLNEYQPRLKSPL